jgi:hypothetical protein
MVLEKQHKYRISIIVCVGYGYGCGCGYSCGHGCGDGVVVMLMVMVKLWREIDPLLPPHTNTPHIHTKVLSSPPKSLTDLWVSLLLMKTQGRHYIMWERVSKCTRAKQLAVGIDGEKIRYDKIR